MSSSVSASWEVRLTVFFSSQMVYIVANLNFFFRYFCRAVEYDEQIKRCIIFEEDSMSQKDDLRVSSSPTHDLYDLVCLDNGKYAIQMDESI